MTGNGLDEAFQRDIRLATSTNGHREVGWAMSIVWLAGLILVVSFQSVLTTAMMIVLAVIVGAAGFGAGYLVFRIVAVWGSDARRAKAQSEYRENMEREKQRRIAEMKARKSSKGTKSA